MTATLTSGELVRLLEAGDLYTLVLRVNRMWLEKDHPEAEYATIVVEVGDSFPAVQVPIIPASVVSAACR